MTRLRIIAVVVALTIAFGLRECTLYFVGDAHAAEPTPRPTPIVWTWKGPDNKPHRFVCDETPDGIPLNGILKGCRELPTSIPLRERMRRAGFNSAHNVQPGEKLPTPRTNVPPPVPLQFAPGVKPTTDMRPK